MFTAQLMMSNPNMWRYNLIWDKILTSGFLNAKRMPLRSHEDILVFYKSLPTYNPQMTIGEPLHSKGVSYKNKELTNNCYGDMKGTDDLRKGSTENTPKVLYAFRNHTQVALYIQRKSQKNYVNILLKHISMRAKLF